MLQFQSIFALLFLIPYWNSAHEQSQLVTIPVAKLSSCLRQGNVTFVLRNRHSKLYEKLNYQWNTFNYIEPLGYIVPENTAQVQVAVTCTRTLDFHIAIKSGGHSYEKYSFGNGSSVVIDLQKFNFVEVNRKKSTAYVGPGVLAGQLEYQLWKDGNYVLPAAVCISVGFGGATLGGGLSWLSKKFGMTTDNVLEFEMVTADGQILTVNSYQNQDLFWALRGGGGGNFGIVTNFKLRIFDASGLHYKLIVLRYPLREAGTVVDAIQKFCLKYVNRTTFLFAVFNETGIVVQLLGFNLSRRNANKLIREFPEPAATLVNRFSTLPELAVFFPISTKITKVSELKDPSNLREVPNFKKVKSYYVNRVVESATIQKLGSVLGRIPPTFHVYIISYGGAINHIPKHKTAFVHRNSIYNVELKIGSNDSAKMSWVKDFDAAISNVENCESYQNMVDATLPDYLQRYYGSNLYRLREIKTNYDPTNFFNFPQSIPPLKI